MLYEKMDQFGYLTQNQYKYQSIPKQIHGITNVQAISSKGNINLALTKDGLVWSWGYNEKLPISTTNSPDALPYRVMDLSNVQSISTGLYHYLVVNEDGTVWAWGYNYYSQLGTEGNFDQTKPKMVEGFSNAKQVFAGNYYSIALKTDGTVWGWGSESIQQKQPTQYTNINTINVKLISTGDRFNYLLDTYGSVTFFRFGEIRQISVFPIPPEVKLWYLETLNHPTAVNQRKGIQIEVVIKFNSAVDSSTINSNNLRLLDGGGIQIPAELRINPSNSREVRLLPNLNLNGGVKYTVVVENISGIGGRLMESPYTFNFDVGFHFVDNGSKIRAGANHSVLMTDYGEIMAWGDNEEGQLGDNTTLPRYMPKNTGSIGSNDLAVGLNHNLVATLDGVVYSWGNNNKGQIGNGNTNPQLYAAKIQGLDHVVAVAAGNQHSLTLKEDGTVWSWGDNSKGQLGIGSVEDKHAPVQVEGLSGVIGIAAGGNHSLALKNDGTVWAWGENTYGQLGNGNHEDQTKPVQVVGLNNVYKMSAGWEHSIALKYDGTVWAWGVNAEGELGDGTDENRLTPVQVQGISSIKEVSSGFFFNLALKSDGSVWLWGDNRFTELGKEPERLASYKPIQLSDWYDVHAIGAGGFHGLAIRGTENEVWGWGYNAFGQVGNGTLAHIPTPVKVENDPISFRLAGNSRTETANVISDVGWNYGADTVILTRDDDFPDALTGTPLAYSLNAPILLTNSKTLTPETAEQIDRLNPRNVFILGSSGAVSSDIELQLKEKYTVTRLGGSDRYETSASIAKYLSKNGYLKTNKAIIASGLNFPDVLAVSSMAAHQYIPILLTEPNTLPANTQEILRELQVSETIIVGGPGAVSSEIEKQLPKPIRFGGKDRYETAVKIAEGLSADLTNIYVATGNNFPDALAGSVLAARTNSPVILVDQKLTPEVSSFLYGRARGSKEVFLLGGSSVVPDTILDELVKYIF